MGWNEDLIAHFRKNQGVITEGPFTGRPVLLLTTTGKATGRQHTTPLVYSREGDSYLIIASKGGAPASPDWYFNLVKEPLVTVEVGSETFQAKATAHAKGPERRRLYDQHSAIHPGFKEYETKTTRQIPTIVLERLPA